MRTELTVTVMPSITLSVNPYFPPELYDGRGDELV